MNDHRLIGPLKCWLPLSLIAIFCPLWSDVYAQSDYKQLNEVYQNSRGPDRQLSRDISEATAITRRFASPFAFSPWAARLFLKKPEIGDAYFCNATLIEARWAITSAYCVDSLPAPDVLVRYGSDQTPEGEIAIVDKIIIHPEFDKSSVANALALLHFTSPIKWTSEQLTHLPYISSNSYVNYGDTKVYGFGSLTEVSVPSATLVQLDVEIVDQVSCNGPNSYDGRILPDMFCARSRLEGIDACIGFGGSGLISFTKDRKYLAGIVSWGEGCGRPDRPTVYTNIPYFKGWIDSVMEKTSRESARH